MKTLEWFFVRFLFVGELTEAEPAAGTHGSTTLDDIPVAGVGDWEIPYGHDTEEEIPEQEQTSGSNTVVVC